MKKNQTKFLVGGFVIIAAVAYLMYMGIKETSVYYLTVSEAQKMADGKEFRMEGTVVPGTIKVAPDSLGAEFSITDQTKSVAINYRGTMPDMFKDEIKVVVQGKLDKNGLFHAHTLLTSCPSKYEASEQGHPQ